MDGDENGDSVMDCMLVLDWSFSCNVLIILFFFCNLCCNLKIKKGVDKCYVCVMFV